MGTFASGIGVANMTTLLSFLDITNTRSLNQRFFRIIEQTIGTNLGNEAIKTMEKELDEEVKLTLKNKIEYGNYKKKELQVPITVQFDMGWSKRSSGNRYDSLSGHAFMIGCFLDPKNEETADTSEKP